MSTTSDVFEHSPTSLRVVVSPASGRLRYLPPQRFVGGVELVEAGQPVARLQAREGEEEILVRAPVGGRVSSVLGIEGEPVVPGQAVLAIEPDAS